MSQSAQRHRGFVRPTGTLDRPSADVLPYFWTGAWTSTFQESPLDLSIRSVKSQPSACTPQSLETQEILLRAPEGQKTPDRLAADVLPSCCMGPGTAATSEGTLASSETSFDDARDMHLKRGTRMKQGQEENSKVLTANTEMMQVSVPHDTRNNIEVSWIQQLQQLLKSSEQNDVGRKQTNLIACTVCKRLFCDGNGIKAHMRIHLPQQSSLQIDWLNSRKCRFCDKCFKDAYRKNRHEMVHSKERPFKCEICEKRYKYRTSLLFHKRKHPDTKPEPVQVSDKMPNRLHILKIAGTCPSNPMNQRLYICKVCNDTFSENWQGDVLPADGSFICNLCQVLWSRAL